MQWRARGYQGNQVVALTHSDQGCALVGLCLSMCEVGVRAAVPAVSVAETGVCEAAEPWCEQREGVEDVECERCRAVEM